MLFETGKIYEFCDDAIVLNIHNEDPKEGYILRIIPYDNVPNKVIVSWKKERYNATIDQAKQHIRDAIAVAKVSQYEKPHRLMLTIPYYPILSVPIAQCEEVLTLIDKVLENYA